MFYLAGLQRSKQHSEKLFQEKILEIVDSEIFRLLTVTKISQERTNQERTKIGPFFDFLLYFSVILLEIYT